MSKKARNVWLPILLIFFKSHNGYCHALSASKGATWCFPMLGFKVHFAIKGQLRLENAAVSQNFYPI